MIVKENTTWRTMRLGELASFTNGRSSPNRSEVGNFPVFGANGIIGYSEKINAEKESIIIGRVGAYCGSVYFSPYKSWVTDNAILCMPRENAEASFLYYLILTLHLNYRAGGSGQPLINQSILDSIEVKVPNHVEQKAISSVLSAFDEKIENNNRIIKTLEEMAQAIFKEWFVKFRFPGYEKVGLVDSELGRIPKGWEVKTLGDVIELAYGKALKEENRKTGTISVVGSSGVVGVHNEKLVTGPGIVVGRKGVAGSVIWVDNDFYPIDTTFYVKTNIPMIFAFFMLKQQNFISGDSAVPGLNREDAYRNEVLIPDYKKTEEFEQVIAPMFNERYQLQKENQKLAAMRDLLLPRLMSGEIRV